jgi:hypothetical protein
MIKVLYVAFIISSARSYAGRAMFGHSKITNQVTGVTRCRRRLYRNIAFELQAKGF